MKKIVILAGLPKAGKSLIAGGLYYDLLQSGRSFFLERLCPDGEGVWTWDSGNQELARYIKNAIKEAGEFFSPAFVQFKCQSIKALAKNFEVLILDLGGVPSPENEKMIRAAVEAAKENGSEILPVLVHKEGQDTKEWEEFFKSLSLTPRLFKTAWDFERDLKSQAMKYAWEIVEKYL